MIDRPADVIRSSPMAPPATVITVPNPRIAIWRQGIRCIRGIVARGDVGTLVPLNVQDTQAAIHACLRALPLEVQRALRLVQWRVVMDLPMLRDVVGDVPDNTRGAFLGHQRVQVEDGDQDGTNDGADAIGLIYLRADCHRSSLDVEETAYHEIGHALGMDEADVTAHGLGFV